MITMKKLILLLSLASVVVAAHAEISAQATNQPQEEQGAPESLTYYGQPIAAKDEAVAVASELLSVDERGIGVLKVKSYRDATIVDLSVPVPQQYAQEKRSMVRELRFVLRQGHGNKYGWLISEIKPATD